MNIQVDYSLLRRPAAIAITTGILVLLYNSISYLHPANNQWLTDGTFSLTNFIRFIFVDQFLIELLTIAILFSVIKKFAEFFNKASVAADFSPVVRYLVSFLPAILASFFVFNPITQTIRFLFNNLPALSSYVYFDSYFYNWRLYFTYLPVVLLAGYGVLIVNLFLNYKKQLKANTPKDSFLLVTDVWGSRPIPYEEIEYIEKEGRYYYVNARGNKFKTNFNFTTLEEKLSTDFIRVNRSVIVNIKQVSSYTFWENDKYLLRLLNGKEFVMSRMRLKNLKSQLKI